MRRQAHTAFAVALALAAGACASTPRSLPAFKASLVRYVDTERYDADVERVAGRAERYLRRNVSGVERPAVVLDIDETSLSNWPQTRDSDFCYEREEFREWVQKASAEALPGVLEFYRAARAAGVAVFFITGRQEIDREATERNLRSVGFDAWNGLDMRPSDYEGTAAIFKTAARQQITDEGYTILVNIGDQESDLAGGYSRKVFKLPNPFYEVP